MLLDRERLPGVRSFYASPVAAAGRVYLTDRDGTTLVLKEGDRLEVLATNKLNDPIDASPVAVGKQLFLRSHGSLYCIEGVRGARGGDTDRVSAPRPCHFAQQQGYFPLHSPAGDRPVPP